MIYTPNSPPANTNIGFACFNPRFYGYINPIRFKQIVVSERDYVIHFQMFGPAAIELPVEPSELEEKLVPSSAAD